MTDTKVRKSPKTTQSAQTSQSTNVKVRTSIKAGYFVVKSPPGPGVPPPTY